MNIYKSYLTLFLIIALFSCSINASTEQNKLINKNISDLICSKVGDFELIDSAHVNISEEIDYYCWAVKFLSSPELNS
ncbi:MAG: hypothetical protein LBU84_04310, partial [Prevotella sp.]|nr:hypothetical protein [Prevotella sp.]